MDSTSFPTWLSTGSSSICSKPVTKKNSLVTASLTPIYFASSYSFSLWICTLSSANLAWMSTFSYCATRRCSLASSFSFFKASVACYFSSSTQRRRASVASAIWCSWKRSSLKSLPSDDGVTVDTVQLE
jgi:hypothetical protein